MDDLLDPKSESDSIKPNINVINLVLSWKNLSYYIVTSRLNSARLIKAMATAHHIFVILTTYVCLAETCQVMQENTQNGVQCGKASTGYFDINPAASVVIQGGSEIMLDGYSYLEMFMGSRASLAENAVFQVNGTKISMNEKCVLDLEHGAAIISTALSENVGVEISCNAFWTVQKDALVAVEPQSAVNITADFTVGSSGAWNIDAHSSLQIHRETVTASYVNVFLKRSSKFYVLPNPSNSVVKITSLPQDMVTITLMESSLIQVAGDFVVGHGSQINLTLYRSSALFVSETGSFDVRASNFDIGSNSFWHINGDFLFEEGSSFESDLQSNLTVDGSLTANPGSQFRIHAGSSMIVGTGGSLVVGGNVTLFSSTNVRIDGSLTLNADSLTERSSLRVEAFGGFFLQEGMNLEVGSDGSIIIGERGSLRIDATGNCLLTTSLIIAEFEQRYYDQSNSTSILLMVRGTTLNQGVEGPYHSGVLSEGCVQMVDTVAIQQNDDAVIQANMMSLIQADSGAIIYQESGSSVTTAKFSSILMGENCDLQMKQNSVVAPVETFGDGRMKIICNGQWELEANSKIEMEPLTLINITAKLQLGERVELSVMQHATIQVYGDLLLADDVSATFSPHSYFYRSADDVATFSSSSSGGLTEVLLEDFAEVRIAGSLTVGGGKGTRMKFGTNSYFILGTSAEFTVKASSFSVGPSSYWNILDSGVFRMESTGTFSSGLQSNLTVEGSLIANNDYSSVRIEEGTSVLVGPEGILKLDGGLTMNAASELALNGHLSLNNGSSISLGPFAGFSVPEGVIVVIEPNVKIVIGERSVISFAEKSMCEISSEISIGLGVRLVIGPNNLVSGTKCFSM